MADSYKLADALKCGMIKLENTPTSSRDAEHGLHPGTLREGKAFSCWANPLCGDIPEFLGGSGDVDTHRN